MPVLILKDKESPPRIIPLAKPTITIGRRPMNDIVIMDPAVSRNHAEVIALADGGYEIRDLGGRHPVRVNDKIVSRHRLRDKDRIEIGGSTLLFSLDEPDAAARVELSMEDGTPEAQVEILALDTRQTIPLRSDGTGTKDAKLLRLSHQRLMLLYEFANSVNAHLEEPSRLMEGALNAAFNTLDAERGFVALVDESSGELTCDLVQDRSARGPSERLAVSRTIVHKALKEGISVLTLDALQDERFGDAASIQEHDIRSAVCVPLLFKDRVLGVIYLDNRATAGRFDEDDLVFLIALGHLAGLALGNARLLRQVLQENLRLVEALKPKFELVGASDKMAQVLSVIKKVAPAEITILIEGETGTGKELAAKAIHALSARSEESFVAINCAAIPKELIESELFGHEKGAFTGASSAREGKFELAGGGTIFQDEIGDMSLETQARVLRALEEREIQRVGGSRLLPVDVRVIAATNKDLGKAVAEGRFREDLFYRLNAVSLKMPPLRERSEDILPLAEVFMAGRGKSISPKARQRLLSYSWPGNVRELKNCIERAMILGTGATIQPEDLPPPIRFGAENIPAPPESLESLEKRHIEQTLRNTSWGKSEAARRLGITRQTLDNKIRKYKIKKPAGEPIA
jgi:transcriptional regulator with GAF, ATPase, and Fis domain